MRALKSGEQYKAHAKKYTLKPVNGDTKKKNNPQKVGGGDTPPPTAKATPAKGLKSPLNRLFRYSQIVTR